jgi:hypothetical protein
MNKEKLEGVFFCHSERSEEYQIQLSAKSFHSGLTDS